MAFQEKQLGQLAPANTTAASIYSPPDASTTGIIKTIVICNTTATSAKFRIFFDDNGTSYVAGTALFYDVPIEANSTVEIDTFLAMSDNTGNLAVRTDTADALTFTVFGAENS